MEGEPEVPDWRPSPTQGSAVMPAFSSAAGGCMFTTSAAPGYPTGPAPRMIRMVFSSMPNDLSSIRAW